MAKNLECANISSLEFLNFLKTAYQVHDSLEGYLTAGGMDDAVDWLKLKQSQLIKNETNCSGSKNGDLQENNDQIKEKLNEVLSEGLLDPVLPHMVPSNTSTTKKNSSTIITNDKLKSGSNTSIESTSTTIKCRNSDIISSDIKAIDVNNNNNSDNKDNTKMKSDSEIEIHVCDEAKKMKKDFICNKNLLVEKMGYFAQVTAGQRLEEMDISVHCDIGIFEWLMKWIKRDQLLEDDWPELTIECVIPILVSASFLQIEELLNDCLLYCHQNMNDILKQSKVNLSCLNDKIIQRLSALYTNEEIENLKDRKDRIQSKLFIKLIQSLNELEPETIRGHYWSLSKIFRCLKCQQLINPIVASNIPCIASCMQLQCDGSIINFHTRDPSWNINDYILKLHENLKTWRKVYWHLWGDVHFLYCTPCKRYFCVRELLWCRYHPDLPQYFTLDTQKAPLPIGRYPCCGERAYRFQLLQKPNNGCQFREHIGAIRDHHDTSILTMLEQHQNLIAEEPPPLLFTERLTRLITKEPTTGGGTTNKTTNGDSKLINKETFWWDGFQIMPPRPKLGLLTSFSNRRKKNNNDIKQSFSDSGDENEDISSNSNSVETIIDSSASTTATTSSSSSSNSCSNSGSEENEKNKKTIRKKKLRRKRKIKRTSRLWQNNQSARSNQDDQRTYEENLMKEMVNFLHRRTTAASIVNISQEVLSGQKQNRPKNVTPIGGVWVRLETEWKESHNIPKINKAPTKKSK